MSVYAQELRDVLSRWDEGTLDFAATVRLVNAGRALLDAIEADELKDGEQWARLSVNVGTEPAAALRRWMDANSINATEAVRRAISVWDFYERSAIDGNQLALLGGDGTVRAVYVDHKANGTRPNPATPQSHTGAGAADQTADPGVRNGGTPS